MEKMPWVYLSGEKVPVVRCTQIPDLHEQLLRYEREGLLKVRRWEEASDKQREIWENVVRRHLAQTDLTTPQGVEYARYIRAHFPNITVEGVDGL